MITMLANTQIASAAAQTEIRSDSSQSCEHPPPLRNPAVLSRSRSERRAHGAPSRCLSAGDGGGKVSRSRSGLLPPGLQSRLADPDAAVAVQVRVAGHACSLANTRRTRQACQDPRSVGVGTPRALNSAAMAREDTAPAARTSAMMGASSDARALARAVRALRPASPVPACLCPMIAKAVVSAF
jgi:hypothetical protein